MSDSFIPLCVPNIKGNAEKYVLETIQAGWVSSVGSFVDRFENEFAEYVGTKYAVAVANGTAALHISLILSDVSYNDEVLVPNLTFVAPANAVKYCGANPVFLDSNWVDLGIDVNKLEDFLNKETEFKNGFTINKKTKAIIKAIIPMHAQGYPVDMDSLNEICKKRNIKVIEDATESLGSEYKGIKTGNFSDLACFSFNGNKIMTTGGGGMIVTNNEELARKAKHISTTAKTDPVQYDHDQVGYNYRLVNVLAALGVAQLELMPEFVETKRKNLSIYSELFQDIDGFSIHTEPVNTRSNYWMYCMLADKDSNVDLLDLIKHFGANKIQVRPIWKLMTTLPMYTDCQSYHCDVSMDIHNRMLNIPCSTDLTEENINRVIKAIKTYNA